MKKYSNKLSGYQKINLELNNLLALNDGTDKLELQIFVTSSINITLLLTLHFAIKWNAATAAT